MTAAVDYLPGIDKLYLKQKWLIWCKCSHWLLYWLQWYTREADVVGVQHVPNVKDINIHVPMMCKGFWTASRCVKSKVFLHSVSMTKMEISELQWQNLYLGCPQMLQRVHWKICFDKWTEMVCKCIAWFPYNSSCHYKIQQWTIKSYGNTFQLNFEKKVSLLNFVTILLVFQWFQQKNLSVCCLGDGMVTRTEFQRATQQFRMPFNRRVCFTSKLQPRLTTPVYV